jgi:hypothetical protein
VTYTWSSSNSGTASVSSSGLVTGVAAGSATITVSASGKTATASITVTGTTTTGSSTVPTPSTQPSGLSYITSRPFNAVTENGWQEPYIMGSGDAVIGSDATSPVNAPHNLLVTDPVGLNAGYTAFSQSYTLSTSPTELFVSVYVKYGSNFTIDQAGITKILYFWANDNVPTLCICTYSTSSSGAFQPQLRTQDATYSNLGPNVSGQTGYTFARNTWVRLDVYLKMNSPGNSDGVGEIWANGTLVANYTNVNYVNSSSQATWATISIAPYWGGAGGTIATPQTVQFSGLYASGN